MANRIIQLFVRSSSSVLKRHNQEIEAKRQTFVENLKNWVTLRCSTEEIKRLEFHIEQLKLIECGYSDLLSARQYFPLASEEPRRRLAAAFRAVTQGLSLLFARLEEEYRTQDHLVAHALQNLVDADGQEFNVNMHIENVLGQLQTICTMDCITNGWMDGDVPVIPALPEVSDDLAEQAKVELLNAGIWRGWQYQDESCRFLGDKLTMRSAHREDNLPTQVKNVIEVSPESTFSIANFVANVINAESGAHSFMEQVTKSDFIALSRAIQTKSADMPGIFLRVNEPKIIRRLNSALSFDILADEQKYGGLTLAQWVRGMSVLHAMQQSNSVLRSGPGSVLYQIREPELVALLKKHDMRGNSAARFLDQMTLRKSSKDLFDAPLIRSTGSDYWVVGGALAITDVVQVMLSLLSTLKADFCGKGKAFEDRVIDFFIKKGMDCQGFTIKIENDEYQYDAVLNLEKHIFIFECKNQVLPLVKPEIISNFVQGLHSYVKQVQRLQQGLEGSRSELVKRFGISAKEKDIVPCVLNSQPFSLPGKMDDVYFCDFPSISQFFESKKRSRCNEAHDNASPFTGHTMLDAELINHFENPTSYMEVAKTVAFEHWCASLGQNTVAFLPRLTQKFI